MSSEKRRTNARKLHEIISSRTRGGPFRALLDTLVDQQKDGIVESLQTYGQIAPTMDSDSGELLNKPTEETKQVLQPYPKAGENHYSYGGLIKLRDDTQGDVI
jgi:hypothetical protein